MILEVKNIPKLSSSDFPKEYREHFNDIRDAFNSNLYNTDKEVKDIIDGLFFQINSKFIAKNDVSVKKLNVSEITIDKKRFQNRTKLNATVLNNIVENYNLTKLDPLIVWREKDKIFLLAGHHRLEATKIKKIKTISVKFFAGNEEEAINFARVESNSNRSLETPIERAKIYRELREKGISKKQILEKAKKNEGKNSNYIINLSYLKANGIVLTALDSLENSDKQNIAIIEKIADWVGHARKNYNNLLLDIHEKEIYDFLMSKDSLRIKTKVDFLQKINSIVSAFDYNKKEPLNLKKFKYTTEGEVIYNKEYKEVKDKIDALIDKKTTFKNRFSNPNSDDFVSPNSSYYEIAIKQLDKQMNKINDEILFYQKKLLKLKSSKNDFINAGSNQGALFGLKGVKEITFKSDNTIEERSNGKLISTKDFKTPSSNILGNSSNIPKEKINKNPFKTSYERLNSKRVNTNLYNLKNIHFHKLLGKIEIKPKQSLVITLDSEAGGGKTHTCYQMAQAFAESGYKSIIWSLEEHVDSNLSRDKQEKYFTQSTQQVISVESDSTDYTDAQNYKRVLESVKYFDVILVDSLTKLLELNSKFSLDKDFRKAFDGKLFVLIVQRTTDGKMRGGAKTGFDGDVILKVDVDTTDFRNNFIYNQKNRYNEFTPLYELKYSPFYQKLIGQEQKEIILSI